ncbi:MAG: glycosyltransferase family 4 protein [Bacteroidota bacterium]
MHIAVLSDPSSFHTKKWTKALKAAGAQVTVFSFSGEELPHVPCVKVTPKFTRKGEITYGSYLYSTQELYTQLARHEIDIVNPINVTPFGVWATRCGYKPIVSIAMGADILEYPPNGEKASFPWSRRWSKVDKETPISLIQGVAKRPVFRHHVAQALKRSDMVMADNQRLIDAMVSWFGVPRQKTRLNRWGIEPELFEWNEGIQDQLKEKYGIRSWQKLVLSPRGVKPIYQGDIIISAFEKLLLRGVRDLKFLMLSAGYEVPQAIAKKAQELSKQFENFHFEEGLIPREEMMQLWSLTDMFISSPVYDGQSNALNEGRFAGAIPIVNPIPANKELIQHQRNGIIVDPFTAEYLADAILEVQESLEMYKNGFGWENQSWIQEHAILSHNISQFLHTCESVILRHQRKHSPFISLSAKVSRG